jgi:hypothetical protein
MFQAERTGELGVFAARDCHELEEVTVWDTLVEREEMRCSVCDAWWDFDGLGFLSWTLESCWKCCSCSIRVDGRL